MDGCDEDTIVTAAREGLRNRKLLWEVARDKPRTWVEFYSLAQQHVAADEYLSSRNEVEAVLKVPQHQPKRKRENLERGGRPELSNRPASHPEQKRTRPADQLGRSFPRVYPL